MAYTIISNPGSNSKKYSIYREENLIHSLYLDPNSGHPQCFIKEGNLPETIVPIPSAKDGAGFLKKFLKAKDISIEDVDAIMIRVVATGDYFAKDHVVDDEYLFLLDRLIEDQHPLHAPIVRDEILALEKTFDNVRILSISDSKFHSGRPDKSMYYGINPTFADSYQIKRYGAHGLSMESVCQKLKKANGKIPEKLIVCHIGSGVSVTAIRNGESIETTMGFTPLEGVMMGTRCGNIDIAAAIQMKKALGYDDNELIEALNLHSGLRGVGGSGDYRDIAANKKCYLDEAGKRPKLAYEMFVYDIVKAIGEMTAVMDGVDAIVFAATISERDPTIRTAIVKSLDYLGFRIDERKNVVNLETPVFDISASAQLDFNEEDEASVIISKPIYVIKIDESEAMLGHKKALLGFT